MKIFSIHYNKPEFISLQKKSIDKFVKFPHEYIVLNNSVDESIHNEIDRISNNLDIRCINCDNNIIGKDSKSHQNGLRKITEIIDEDDVFMIMDHDVFLINEIYESYYNNYDFLYMPQISGHIEYPAAVLIVFNKVIDKKLISFELGEIEGQICDTGGYMYYYMKNNNLKKKVISERHIFDGDMLMAILDYSFLHLISGSDWNSNYNLIKKLEYLKEVLDK